MNKCGFCKYSNIERILCYDMLVDKCSKCDTIRLSFNDYDNFLMNYIRVFNFMNVKKKLLNCDFSKYEKDILNDFLDIMGFHNFRFTKNASLVNCNFCNDDLYEMNNIYYKKFKILFCRYCNSIYINKSDFEKAASYLSKYVIKRHKWYGFVYKFLEIFR